MSHEILHWVLLVLPVKMFLNASSTFVESNADVSINERVFFSNDGGEETCVFNMHKVLHRTIRLAWLALLLDLPAKARASSVGTALR